MFGTSTPEKMPDEFLTNPAAWDRYIGQVWQGLLSYLNLGEESCVIDIAPGSSIKLGAALAKLSYRGHLYMVDSSAAVLKALEVKYAELLPRAKVHWVCGSLREQLEVLPANPDYLLGNHILDDMILAASGTPQEQADTFLWATAYTSSPSAAFQQSWQRLSQDPALLSTSKQMVKDDLVRAVETLKPVYIILSQYPSSTLYDSGMGSLNDHAFSVFEMLKGYFKTSLVDQADVQAVLDTNKNFGNAHIGDHVLNAKYWMLCRLKTI